MARDCAIADATAALVVVTDAAAAAWLRVIQTENSCKATGRPCDAKRCGCKAEQETLIAETTND
jgi:hypothetical protein